MAVNQTRNLYKYLSIIVMCLGLFILLKYGIGVESHMNERLSTYAEDPDEKLWADIEAKYLASMQISAEFNKIEDKAAPETSIMEESQGEQRSTNEARKATPDYTSEKYFSELIQTYRADILDRIPPSQNRTDITVRYYPHSADSTKVMSLKQYRFYLHRREPEANARESNSIYFGDSVRSVDIQLIAYTLLKNGFALRQIVPSQFHDSWKARSVEIGADPDAEQLPIMSIEEIQEFSNPYNREK